MNRRRRILVFSGFINSGKSTASRYFVENYGAARVSFAAALKDVVAPLFGWDREALEGNTPESRAWREQPDPFWSKVYGKPITPRYVLQFVGTEVVRLHLHVDQWTNLVRKRLDELPDALIVIDDARFLNERALLREYDAMFYQLWRPQLHTEEHDEILSQARLGTIATGQYAPTLHMSEWGRFVDPTAIDDAFVWNIGTQDDLYKTLEGIYYHDRM